MFYFILLLLSLVCVVGVLFGARIVSPNNELAAQHPSLISLVLIGSVPIIAIVVYSLTGSPELIGAQSTRMAAPSSQGAPGQQPPAQPTAQDINNMVAGLEARLRENPDDIAGWRMLARSQLVLGRGGDAVVSYDEILRRAAEPTAADLRGAIGARLTRDGDAAAEQDAVFALLQQLQGISPDDPMALFYMGNALDARGNAELANTNWRKLQAQLPDSSPMHAILAEKLGQTGASVTPNQPQNQP